jgi:nucleotide-binding universal stress UspA family protein
VYQRILVPHDGSAFAEQVLPHVTELARCMGAEVHLLEVIPPPNPALFSSDVTTGIGAEITLEALDEAEEEMREVGEHRFEILSQQLAADGIKTQWQVREGDPAQTIVDYVTEQGVDLVAMASHGRSGFARAILGSVTDSVLRHAPCPVLVVRASEPGER